MKISKHYIASIILLLIFFINCIPITLACGPSYISPVFENTQAPEDPYQNFASGKLGIIKPDFRRVVLFAAYRYLNGGGFNFDEQKSLIEVWEAEFNNKDFRDDDISEVVKDWVKGRKAVFPKEEKLPEIYTERSYGGYEFFPNCTKNAFETAIDTLNDRINSYGSDSKDVQNWLLAQDKVFTNCATGRQIPESPDQTMPEWLQKDRAYQLAAAEFYSMNYEEAKNRFAEIGQDLDSPWQEVSEYLVGRTLIRQASAAKDKTKRNLFYSEAEQQLQTVASRGGKYSESAEKLIGLVKYRLRPQERVGELAQDLSFQTGGKNLRQDLIDYSWLLDKFEKEGLEAEEKRKEALKAENLSEVEKKAQEAADKAGEAANTALDANKSNDNDLEIYFSNEDYSQSWNISVKFDATDEEAIAEGERVAGNLTEKMKEQIRNGRQSAYASRFDKNYEPGYQGGYYGEEERSLSVLPEFLRKNDLTDWLFTYQIQNNEAYLYSLSKFRQSGSEIWLMTAISKAKKSSTELEMILEAANKVSSFSPAYLTIAYHQARLFIELNKQNEAKKLIDDVLNSTVEMPVSSRNQFLALRTNLAETLDEFLKFSIRQPFAFNWDGTNGSIESFIALQKSYYDPEFTEQSKEDYEKEIEERFKEEKLWDNRKMFDFSTIESINEYFPLETLLKAERSPELPDYLRERFAVAIWTRAMILDDFATADKIETEFLKFKPELRGLMQNLQTAKTPKAKQDEAIYLILKNPMLTPFIEDGLGRTDNEFSQWDSDDWWCAPYEPEPDSGEGDSYKPFKPGFLTDQQTKSAQSERKKIGQLGDAPKYLGEKVLEWAKRSPLDKRVPESLYIVYEANGWTKYGCGNNNELREQIGKVLFSRYPKSEWTIKIKTENENQ